MTSAKAIVGGILSAILAGLTALASVLVGNDTLHSVTTGQWVAIIIAVLATGSSVFGGVWAVTNNPAPKILSLPVGSSNITSTIPLNEIASNNVSNSAEGPKIGDTPSSLIS